MLLRRLVTATYITRLGWTAVDAMWSRQDDDFVVSHSLYKSRPDLTDDHFIQFLHAYCAKRPNISRTEKAEDAKMQSCVFQSVYFVRRFPSRAFSLSINHTLKVVTSLIRGNVR